MIYISKSSGHFDGNVPDVWEKLYK